VSRDLTTPVSGVIVIRGFATINLPNKLELFMSTRYEDIKGDTKCGKWGGLG